MVIRSEWPAVVIEERHDQAGRWVLEWSHPSLKFPFGSVSLAVLRMHRFKGCVK